MSPEKEKSRMRPVGPSETVKSGSGNFRDKFCQFREIMRFYELQICSEFLLRIRVVKPRNPVFLQSLNFREFLKHSNCYCHPQISAFSVVHPNASPLNLTKLGIIHSMCYDFSFFYLLGHMFCHMTCLFSDHIIIITCLCYDSFSLLTCFHSHYDSFPSLTHFLSIYTSVLTFVMLVQL